ncbi:uncharacterized protein LY79DRAFT_557389 [Colletotrichum navitas]|uniref:Uncharacterized protein n=1 Tax=Colletotrichum navitas TaxID=681940 RepID=A0AAD8V3M9_9PEZI|nr:uncharacterized protein LY79DRAFT_557389 [Colletotrichum navitas]KAK1586058.1 hypothetical protein LY79DRAFT_557389 [Colletotrichum navitas]
MCKTRQDRRIFPFLLPFCGDVVLVDMVETSALAVSETRGMCRPGQMPSRASGGVKYGDGPEGKPDDDAMHDGY